VGNKDALALVCRINANHKNALISFSTLKEDKLFFVFSPCKR
jgi:hypothetical protein